MSAEVFTMHTAPLTLFMVLAMGGTILFTYTTCVLQQECPALPHLPTISNTWTHPPGNYVSRFVVSVLCVGLGLVQPTIWLPQKGKTPHATLFLGLGLFAIFCLSWVGAICDGSNPQCRGDNNLHVACAMTFFVLYNMNMVVLTAHDPLRSRCAPVLLVTCLLLKVRWAWAAPLGAWAPPPLEDETPLAIVEWSDVALVMGWTYWWVRTRCDGATLSLVSSTGRSSVEPLAAPLAEPCAALGAKQPPCPDDGRATAAAPQVFLSARSLALVVMGLFFGTLATTLAAIFAEGRVPKGTWPFISDMWVYPPGDWISRWAVPLAGTWAIFCQVCLYYLDGQGAPGLQLLACVAVLGVSLVGCVDESEDLALHGLGAFTFFLGYDLYMALRLAALLRARRVVRVVGGARAAAAPSPRALLAQAACAAVSCLATAARYAPPPLAAAARLGLPASHTVEAVIEWANALAIISYFGISILAHGNAARATGLRINCAADARLALP